MDVADRLEIMDLLARYGHCYDEGDVDDLGPLFTEDAVFRFDPPITNMPATLSGREMIVGMLRERYAATLPAQRRHVITNVLIDSEGPDAADVRSYILLGSTVDGQLSLPVTGRYLDRVVRHEGRWRYAERLLTLDIRIG